MDFIHISTFHDKIHVNLTIRSAIEKLTTMTLKYHTTLNTFLVTMNGLSIHSGIGVTTSILGFFYFLIATCATSTMGSKE